MPLSEPDRIEDDRRMPRSLALWRALQPLRSVVSFMNTGAHPDDETSEMLAALTFRDGVNLSYACANRGEGGQNDIGQDVTEDLGTVRTAEMERAADVLDMRLYWLSESPDDLVFDFGFSKSGIETMGRWTRDRVLERFVDIVRQEKPDIICPTFLDIPGQHGHHRAMTEAAHLVMDLAADSGFSGSDLPVWQVSKMYLPAWSGAGGAYDDEVPPPPATVTVDRQGEEELSGWTWERIGQHSRWFHKTQGMGHWVSPGSQRDWPLHLANSSWPLHLAHSHVGGDTGAITDNLPQTLRDLSASDAVEAGLVSAQLAIHDAVDAFPDRAAVLKAASAAHRALARIEPTTDIAHHVSRKIAQLARVIRLASGTDVRGWLAEDWLIPGQTVDLTVEVKKEGDTPVSVSVLCPESWQSGDASLTVSPTASPSDPYPPVHDPLEPRAPALRVEVGQATSLVPLEIPPLVLPQVTAQLSKDAGVINLATDQRTFRLNLSDVSGGAPSFHLPEGWQQAWDKGEVVLTAPNDLAPALYELPLRLDDQPAMTVRRFTYPHIAPRLRSFPATLRLRAVHVELPKGRIGYIGAGNDKVAGWLEAIGCDMTVLDETALSVPAVFDSFDALVIGVFANRFRADLRARMSDIHAWVRDGGNLVTLYHRPWDLWNPDTTPPARLEIGQPSLRWRVTDENAEVIHLVPDHPLLTGPNPIGPDDWAGWHKERGLYFAKSWDSTYTPLLEMADPDEDPHKGALLTAEIGKGRHTHCCLILHHQMEKLTPGAFRLMSNLLAKR